RKLPKRSACRRSPSCATGSWRGRGCFASWGAALRITPERWRRIEQLYHAALKRDVSERAAFLNDACGGDDGLRREVDSLLEQPVSRAGFLDGGALETAAQFVRDTDHTLSAGAHLGPYEVTALLGVGGMGEVYRAHDPRLGRDVAIKVLPASVHTDPQARARFEREGRAISALNHPNICTLFDVGPNYLVTELVEGETLRNVMTKGLTVDRSIEIAKQVLEALCAAHRAAIIHRDLKPHNIMVRFDGYVKVLDFGLAKQLTELTTPDGQSRITSGDVSREGQILGTVAYMSTEQILGAEIDHRSDLFAVGIILHEMVTGRHPWPRPSPVDTLHAILHDAPPADAGSETVAELAIARKLLSKNAADRYPSAEAVLEALAVRSVPHASSTASASTAEALTAIAVLPFVFLNDAEERKAFALGFADALITVLGSLEDVAVLPTSAILNYAAGSDPAQTCRDL